MDLGKPFPFALIPLLLPLLAGCPGKAPGPPPLPEGVPVTVARVEKKPFVHRLQATGHVEPSDSVAVKSQVEGTLVEVGFTEGREVREGDLLFRIDPRPFEDALDQARAVLARDRAQLETAKREAARYSGLADGGMVSQETAEQFRTAAKALESTVAADEAAAKSAELRLSYTRITAPIGGRTGNIALRAGNLVSAAGAPLVVINRLRPVHVVFTIPEKDLPPVRAAQSRAPLPVLAGPPGEASPPSRGALFFIDNQVDPATGSILLKGAFPNDDRRLWPGQSVDVTLDLGTAEDALVVPSSAVQSGQKGDYVFVVGDDGAARLRPVGIGLLGDSEAVVRSGLSPGDRVVTDGQVRLTDGARVSVKGAPAGTGR